MINRVYLERLFDIFLAGLIRFLASFGAVLGYLAGFSMVFLPVIMPLQAARAQSLTIDPTAPRGQRATIGRSSGGKAVINITRPNAGISHNRFRDFSTSKGLIFNNSNRSGRSVTGGYVTGNKNLSSGSANVILNEIRGRKSSDLSGVMEVYGARADVIIANENGVNCNGCSFLNAGRATLTTGRPYVSGSKIRLDVRKGTVGVWGKGLSGADDIDLVGRHVVIDGAVVSKKSITASGGAQRFDYNTRQSRSAPVTGKRTGPYAVDGTAFGSLKSGQIKIIGNESGLGVRMDSKMSSSGDILFRSRGNAQVKSMTAGGKITIEATGKVLQSGGQIYGKKGVAIAGQSFENNRGASVRSDGDVTIKVRDFVSVSGEVTGKSVSVIANKSVLNLGKVLSGQRLDIVAGEVKNKRPVTSTYATYYDSWIRRYVPWLKWYTKRYKGSYNAKYYTRLLNRSSYTALKDQKVLSGGEITGGDITITAKISDIINDGTITASSNLVLTAKRDIINKALFERHRKSEKDCAWGDCYSAKIYQARIEAKKNAKLIAGRDILNNGGAIEGRSGLSLTAGRDIKNSTIAWRDQTRRNGATGSGSYRKNYSGGSWWRRYSGYYGGGYRYTNQSEFLRHNIKTGSITSSAGKLSLQAKQDIVNNGGTIAGVYGLNARAGRDLLNTSESYGDKTRYSGTYSSYYYGGSSNQYYGGWYKNYSYYGGSYNSSWSNEHVRQQTKTSYLGSLYGISTLSAGRDLINKGGRIEGYRGLTALAGRNILNISVAFKDSDDYQRKYSSSYYGGSGYKYGWWWGGSSYYGGSSNSSWNAKFDRNRILSGYLGSARGKTYLSAGNDLINQGGIISGTYGLTARAKGNILNVSAAFSDRSRYHGGSNSSYYGRSSAGYSWWQYYKSYYGGQNKSTWSNDYVRQNIRQGSMLSSLGNLSLIAGRDISLAGATAHAGKTLTLDAGHAINILTARYRDSNSYKRTGSNSSYSGYRYGWWWGRSWRSAGGYNYAWSNSQNKNKASAISGYNVNLYARGSSLTLQQNLYTKGDVSLYAYRDITNRYGVSSGGNVSLYSRYGSIKNPGWVWARKNISARAYYNIDSRYLAGGGKTSVTALYGSVTNRDYLDGVNLSVYAKYDINNYSKRQYGIYGTYSASLRAGRDINLIGSGIKSYGTIALRSGRDINIRSYLNGQTDVKKSYTGRVYGTQKWRTDWYQKANIASLKGRDISLVAGRNVNLTGAQLNANNNLALNAGSSIISKGLGYRAGGDIYNRRWYQQSYKKYYKNWYTAYSWYRTGRWWRRRWQRRAYRTYNWKYNWSKYWTYANSRSRWNNQKYYQNALTGTNVSLQAGTLSLGHASLTSGNDLNILARSGSLYADNIGTLKAGRDLNIQAQGNLKLHGGLTFGRNIALTAKYGWLDLNTKITSPGRVSLYAYRDIINRSSINAGGNVSVYSQYGSIKNSGSIYTRGNVNLRAYYNVDNHYLRGYGDVSVTALHGSIRNRSFLGGKNLSLYAKYDITSSGHANYALYGAYSLKAIAGRDINNLGAGILSYGTVSLQAGRNIKSEGYTRYSSRNLAWNPNGVTNIWQTNWYKTGARASYITGKNINLTAGGNIDLIGAILKANNNLGLYAGGAINSRGLEYGSGWNRTTRNWYKKWYRNYYTAYSRYSTGRWWWRRWHTRAYRTYNWKYNWKFADRKTSGKSIGYVGNSLTGANVSLNANTLSLGHASLTSGNDLNILARSGSLIADNLGSLKAGRDLNIQAQANLKLHGGILFGRNIGLTAKYGWMDLNTQIKAPGDVNLYAYRGLTNRNSINAGGNVSLYSQYGSINNSGRIDAKKNINLRAYYNITNSNTIRGYGDINLTALYGSLTNKSYIYSDGAYRSPKSYYTKYGRDHRFGSVNLYANGNIDNFYARSRYGNVSATAKNGSYTNRYYTGGWGNKTTISARYDINNTGGGRQATIYGRYGVSLKAGRDIWNTGGKIYSYRDVTLQAGRDIHNRSVLSGKSDVKNSYSGRAYGTQHWRTDWFQKANLATISGVNVNLIAGNNIELSAAQLKASNALSLNAGGQIYGKGLSYAYGGNKLDRRWWQQSYKKYYKNWYTAYSWYRTGSWWRRRWRRKAYRTYNWKYNWARRWKYADTRNKWSGRKTYNTDLSGNSITLNSGTGINLANFSAENKNTINFAAQRGNISLTGIGRLVASRGLNFNTNGNLTISGGRTWAPTYNWGNAKAITLGTTIGDYARDFVIDSRYTFTNNGAILGKNVYLSANSIRGNGKIYAKQDVDLWSKWWLTSGAISGRYVDLYSSDSAINLYGAITASKDATLDAKSYITADGNITANNITLSAYTGAITTRGTLNARTGDLYIDAKTRYTNNGSIYGNNISVYANQIGGKGHYNARSGNLTLDAGSWVTTGWLTGKNITVNSANSSIGVYGTIRAANNATLTAKTNLYAQSITAKDAYLLADDGKLTLASSAKLAIGNSLTLDTHGDFNVLNGQRFKVGKDLTIRAGGNINVKSYLSGATYRQSSLSAGRDLYLTAGGNILNSGGSITAGRNLVAYAGGSISNIALKRSFTLTSAHGCYGKACGKKGFDYKVAEIKAGNGLILNAGLDIINKGSKILGKGFVNLTAGRDITNESLTGKYKIRDYYYHRTKCNWWGRCKTTTIVDKKERAVFASAIIQSTGGEIFLTAGRDLNNLGGLVTAKKDLTINVTRDINLKTKEIELFNAKNNSHNSGWFGWSYSSSHDKAKWNEFTKVQSVLKGNNLYLYGGGNLTAQGAVLLASHNLNLSVGGHILILAQVNKKYYKVSRGSSSWFGLVKKDYDYTREDTLVNGSGIETGNDIDIVSQYGDVVFQSASLSAGNNIAVDAQRGSIQFLNQKASEYEQTKTYDSNGLWWKSRDKGHYTETVVHNHLLAGGSITLKAANGIIVEYKEGKGDLDATIASLARAPELAWMLQIKGRNDVEWRAVKAAAKTWDHKAEGLTEAASALIALAVTLATSGAAGGLAATMAGTTQAAIAAGTATTAQVMMAQAITAGLTQIASRATVSLINNKGDLGAVLRELGSSTFIKSLATGMITAGVLAGLNNTVLSNQSWGITNTGQQTLTRMDTLVQDLMRGAIRTTVSTAISTGINGGDFRDNLINGLKGMAVNQLLPIVHEKIGDLTDGTGAADLPVANMVAHALAGGLAAEALGGSFAAGAASALSSAVAANAGLFDGLNKNQISTISQLVGATAALLAGGSAADVNQGATTASSAAINNYLTHANLRDMKIELKVCKAKPNGCSLDDERKIAVKWINISLKNDKILEATCTDMACVDEIMKDRVAFTKGFFEINGLSSSIAGYLRDTGAFFLNKEAAGQISKNIEFSDDYKFFVKAKCGGVSSSECVTQHLTAWEKVRGRLELVEKAKLMLSMTLAGGVGGAFAIKGVQILKTCMSNPLCLNNLGITIAEIAAGDALGGSPIGTTISTGSRIALRHGDQIIGIIDDQLGRLVRVSDPANLGNKLFAAADGSLHNLNSVGELVRTGGHKTDLPWLEGLSREAQGIISSNSNTKLNRLAALSQARVTINGQLITSPTYKNLLGKAKSTDGIEMINNGSQYKVTNIDDFISSVKKTYIESGQNLHSTVEQRIRQHVANGRVFDNAIGVPGLHAEVQAYNYLLSHSSNINSSTIRIGTIKLGRTTVDMQGGNFTACTNCGGIIPSTARIVTGR